MALGMKRWLGLVAVGFALVALSTLPPKALELPVRRNLPLQAERRLEALRNDIMRANATLQQVRWAEAVVPATLAGAGPVVVGFPDNAAPEQVEEIRALTLAEVAGDPTSDVAVGVFLEDYWRTVYPGAPTGGQVETHYFFGRRDGRPYCAAVHPVWRSNAAGERLLSSQSADGSFLGVCALVRRYGLPGPAVRAWLADGGTALAATGRPGGSGVPLYRSVTDAVLARRGFLGTKDPSFGYLFTRVDHDRCFAGVTAGCAEMFLHPVVDNNAPAPGLHPGRTAPSPAPASAVQANSLFAPADYHVVADLAEEFGRDRFLEWWTADGDVAEAFQASFGVELGAWNLRRIGNYVSIAKPGPGVSESGLLGGVLLLALATVIGGLWSRRRRVA